MVIPHPNSLKQSAAQALARGREPKKVVLAYAGIGALTALVLTLISAWLDVQIGQTGGLSNLGARSALSTAQAILPFAQILISICLEMGYISAMLRIARGQYADHTDLKVGFQRFFPALRMMLLQALLYVGIAILCFYVCVQIFVITPWSGDLAELLAPLVESGSTSIVIDDANMDAMISAMLPLLLMYLVVYLVAAALVRYRLRMAAYSLMDHPQAGAMAALRASRKMMRRNCWRLFQVDLRLWWYYLLSALAIALAYGDVAAALIGISLPISATAAYYLFYLLSLAAQFALSYFARNQVEMRYVMAYEAICEKPADNGVVLGNIFDM